MLNLNFRSDRKELLDGGDIPFAAIKQNMKELNRINTLLGGHAITVSAVKKLIQGYNMEFPIVICEIGCGGGDNLLAISRWCSSLNLQVKFIGIDLKAECIAFAKQQCKNLDAIWIVSDYSKTQLAALKPDIIFSSLFCHHFDNDALPGMLKWMKQHATIGFFINDLHRHFLAYYSIKTITALFSKSYLVKHDAPVSVARGFKTKEWKQLFAAAGITRYSLQWRWAFRHLMVYKHE